MKILISVVAMMFLMSCMGSTSSSDWQNSSEDIGDSAFGTIPVPEDIFDLPSTIPNDFYLQACPDLSGSGFVATEDLLLWGASPSGAPNIDFAPLDGIADATVLVQGDLNPHSITFTIDQQPQSLFDPAMIHGSIGKVILSGFEIDESGTPLGAPIPNVWSTPLLTSAWVAPHDENPLAEQYLVPGTPASPPPPAGFSPFPPWGFEGEKPGPSPYCSYNITLCPGIHVFAVYVADTFNTLHCTQKVWRVIVCPVAGLCDAQGAPFI